MYPKSIFTLPRKKEDLISANQGMSNLFYDQVASLRTITDTGNNINNFGNGIITYRFHPPSGSWWVPSRSYFRIDCSLSLPNGTSPLTGLDDIAVNMGIGSCLFSKQQYKINDKTISEISEHVPQVDAIKTRLRKSGQWLDTTGSNFNFWQDKYEDRKRAVTSDSSSLDSLSVVEIRNIDSYANLPVAVQWRNLVNYNAGDTLQIDADNNDIPANESSIIFIDTLVANRVRFIDDNGDLDPALSTAGLEVGKVIQYTDSNAHLRYGVIKRIESAGAGDVNANTLNRIVFTKSTENYGQVIADNGPIGDPANGLYGLRGVDTSKPRQVKKFSIIYQPPLSIFGLSHAIPGSSKHEIDLVPFSNSVYQKNCIESLLADRIHTTDGVNGDFRFKVEDMLFYSARCDGPIVEKDEFFLDLEETRAQIASITTANQSQFSLDISPATHAITVAFQDESAETNTLYSQTKFKIRNNEELNLTNFYIRYAGNQKPQPNFRPVYDESANTDLLVEQYGRSVMYNGSYYDSSSETLDQWRERGMYLHFPWPKTGSDRETRVYVSTEFSNLTGTPRLIVFNHFNKVCILRYENGSLKHVLVNEV